MTLTKELLFALTSPEKNQIGQDYIYFPMLGEENDDDYYPYEEVDV
jgi:hypothetical protein